MITIVLSGGVGSRLWPLSRLKLPKQFCEIFSETLFAKTINRFQGELVVVTNTEQKVLVDIELKNKKSFKVFYEPVGRNTAPAVALACGYLQSINQLDEICGVFPSDHWIDDEKTFLEVIAFAESAAKLGKIVTLGITPTYPSTGFGYIELSNEKIIQNEKMTVLKALGFHEKPKLEKAESFLKQGNFVWNSGMFIFKVRDMIEAFKIHTPELWTLISGFDFKNGKLDELYKRLPSISLDYAVMEKINNHVCIPTQFGWSDLGSWDDIAKFSQKKSLDQKNFLQIEAKNNYILSNEKKTVAVVGVDDLNIIDTTDALLIVKKGQGQKVKNVVESLEKLNPGLVKEHLFEKRPWGQYTSLHEENDFKTKIISVNPGEQLSYQSHQQREEIWVIVSGQGEVVLNDETIKVSKGSVIKIPKQSKHRIRNNGSSLVRFVEVQMGDYFGEDDITRYSDDYGRMK